MPNFNSSGNWPLTHLTSSRRALLLPTREPQKLPDLLDLSFVARWKNPDMLKSLDWFKGKSTGNHGFYHQI